MIEKLCAAAQEDLRLGLLSPTMARQLTRLPAGNQQRALETGRRNSLSAAELRGVTDLLLASGTQEKATFVLERPREALREAQAGEVRGWDPRLSAAGNRVSRQLAACWTSWPDGELAAAPRPRRPRIVRSQCVGTGLSTFGGRDPAGNRIDRRFSQGDPSSMNDELRNEYLPAGGAGNRDGRSPEIAPRERPWPR